MSISRKRRLRRVLTYLAVYAIFAMVLSGCADRLILFPTRDAIAVPGASRREVKTSTGSVEVWTMPSAAAAGREPQAFVLHFVGNGDRAEWGLGDVARQWAELPVEAWSVNYPGYGGSSGSARLKAIGPAALAAYDELKRHAGSRPIFVSGHSIGTTAALHVAANRPGAGLVLHNPPPLRNLILGKFGWWNLWLAAGPVALHVPSDLDSIANAKKSHAPSIFLLAAHDSLVPPAYQQKVVDAYAGPKHVLRLRDYGHNDLVAGAELQRLQTELEKLLEKTVGPAVESSGH